MAGWLSASWRKFLLDEAYRDPEALIILLACRELLGLGRTGPAPAVGGKAVEPGFADAERATGMTGFDDCARGAESLRAWRPLRESNPCFRRERAVS